MSPARRERGEDPVPLADAVARVGRDLGLPEPDELSVVLARWPEVVGEDLATHARVHSLRDGVLTVGVDAPAFATELRYRETELCRHLAAAPGAPRLHRLRVVVARPG